jgi:predicted alpha-1,6-mannanase (GH76 family)
MHFQRFRLFVLVCCLALSGIEQPALAVAPTVPRAQAFRRLQAGAAALQRWYVQRTGLYKTTGWWNAANAITVLTDAMRAVGTKQYEGVLARTFTRAQITVPKAEQTGALKDMTGAPGFLNNYYDDEGWWALAWIDAYDLTGRSRYLAMGQSIFANMAGGWDNTCGGGIWWSKDKTYKNAIANELFFSVAAHLAARASTPAERAAYAGWATSEWTWFRRSGMINSDSLVNDGLTIDKATGACTNNGKTVWTYNQGVLSGALPEWSKIAPGGGSDLLTEARRIADSSLMRLTGKAGVLHDPCEPDCGGDGIQFKGIFVRNLQALNEQVHDPAYARFFAVNAQSIWENDRGPGNMFGVVWSGPYASANAGTQTSALDALVAAAGAQRLTAAKVPDRKNLFRLCCPRRPS